MFVHRIITFREYNLQRWHSTTTWQQQNLPKKEEETHLILNLCHQQAPVPAPATPVDPARLFPGLLLHPLHPDHRRQFERP